MVTLMVTKLGMEVFRGKRCLTYNFLTSLLPKQLSQSRSPSSNDISLLLPRLHFKLPIKSAQLPLNKTSPFKKFDCRYLQKLLWFQTASIWHDFRRNLHQLLFQFLFQVTATAFTELLNDGSSSRWRTSRPPLLYWNLIFNNPLKSPWQIVKNSQKIPWKFLKMSWKSLKILWRVFKNPLKRPWKSSENPLRIPWISLEMSLKKTLDVCTNLCDYRYFVIYNTVLVIKVSKMQKKHQYFRMEFLKK